VFAPIPSTRPFIRDFRREATVLYTILIVLVIIAVAMFIWRNMAGRRA